MRLLLIIRLLYLSSGDSSTLLGLTLINGKMGRRTLFPACRSVCCITPPVFLLAQTESVLFLLLLFLTFLFHFIIFFAQSCSENDARSSGGIREKGLTLTANVSQSSTLGLQLVVLLMSAGIPIFERGIYK